MKRFLEAGRLNSPRGLKGEVRFSCWCDSPDFLCGISRLYLDGDGKRPLKILQYRPEIPSFVFEGYEDRTTASALTGRTIWFDRNDITLPEGVCFNDDLIGLDVFDANTNEKIGVLVEIEEGAASDFYHVKGKKNYIIPCVDEFVTERCPDKGYIKVVLIEGFEDAL